MKIIISLMGIFISFLICLSGFSYAAGDENILFLHHSVGGNLYNYSDMGLENFIAGYNDEQNTSYSIENWEYPGERDYSPYAWNNYPFDYWNLWVNDLSSCNSELCSGDGYRCIECLDNIVESHEIVVLKHCYGGSDILEDQGLSNVLFPRKSLENYKLQYVALLETFDEYNSTLFIVFTLPPRNKDYSSAGTPRENAARATEFTEWVKNEWLDDGADHENVVIFDIREFLVEKDSYSDYYNFLKDEYSTGVDSHPNDFANNVIGPIFGDFLINETQEFFGINLPNSPSCGDDLCEGDETCLTCSGDCGQCEASQVISFEQGWNIFSVNINVTLNSSEFISPLILDYREGSWVADFSNKEGDEFLIEPLKGYYVYSTEITSLEIIGTNLISAYVFPLVSGSNLISVNQESIFSDIYLQSIAQENIYEINPQFPTEIGSFNPTNTLDPSNIYWVYESVLTSKDMSFFERIANFFKSLFS